MNATRDATSKDGVDAYNQSDVRIDTDRNCVKTAPSGTVPDYLAHVTRARLAFRRVRRWALRPPPVCLTSIRMFAIDAVNYFRDPADSAGVR